VTIAAPDWRFEAQFEEDEFHMLWLVDRHSRAGERCVGLLLSAALENGCPIVNATPGERVLLEEHGFRSGRVQ
jgi:hypothetical protein